LIFLQADVPYGQ
jgi:hypothetical protein